MLLWVRASRYTIVPSAIPHMVQENRWGMVPTMRRQLHPTFGTGHKASSAQKHHTVVVPDKIAQVYVRLGITGEGQLGILRPCKVCKHFASQRDSKKPPGFSEYRGPLTEAPDSMWVVSVLCLQKSLPCFIPPQPQRKKQGFAENLGFRREAKCLHRA